MTEEECIRFNPDKKKDTFCTYEQEKRNVCHVGFFLDFQAAVFKVGCKHDFRVRSTPAGECKYE